MKRKKKHIWPIEIPVRERDDMGVNMLILNPASKVDFWQRMTPEAQQFFRELQPMGPHKAVFYCEH